MLESSQQSDFLSLLHPPCETIILCETTIIIFSRKEGGQIRNYKVGSNSEGSLPERRRKHPQCSVLFSIFFERKQRIDTAISADISTMFLQALKDARIVHSKPNIKMQTFHLREMKWVLSSFSLTPISFMFDCFAFNMGQAAGGRPFL